MDRGEDSAPGRSRFLVRAAGAGLATFVFLAAFEIALRALPQAVPLDLLEYFAPGPRSAIAARRQLTRREDTTLLPRDDGGPQERMWIHQPRREVTHHYEEPHLVKTIRVDDQGFCNPVADAYETTERFDLIAIGDSFTFCTTVDPADTWPIYTGEQLDLSVYNLAMPGRGLYEYLQILEQRGLAKSPRYVAMNIYEGNDLRDAYKFHVARDTDGSETAAPPCPFESDRFCSSVLAMREGRPGRSSYAFNFLQAALWHLAVQSNKREIDFKYEVTLADGSKVGMNSRNGDREEVEFARMLVSGAIGPSLFDEALERFMDLSREHGFVPLVLYTPSAYTAYARISRFDDEAIGQTMRAYSDALREYFASRAPQLGYHYDDVTPHLIEAASRSTQDELVYFRTNVHLTPAGHRVVADRLAGMIEPLEAAARGAAATGKPAVVGADAPDTP